MNISDLLAQTGGLQQMARELGISEADAARGAQALAPAILGGFKKQAQAQPSGLEGLGGLLGRLGGDSLLAEVVNPQPTDLNRGNNVLGEIFGSKDVSRTVAQHAASQSGVDAGILKKMLPMLAMAIAGYMARGGGATGTGAGPAAGGGLAGMLGGLLGGSGGGASSGLGGLASMLDMNGDGNPLDDLLRMTGRGSR
jgi:hypothetical protein